MRWLCHAHHRYLHGNKPAFGTRHARPEATLAPDRLRHLRTRRVLTQKQLADLAGIRWQTISDIESGRHAPRATTIQRLAAALGVSPETLAGTAE